MLALLIDLAHIGATAMLAVAVLRLTEVLQRLAAMPEPPASLNPVAEALLKEAGYTPRDGAARQGEE